MWQLHRVPAPLTSQSRSAARSFAASAFGVSAGGGAAESRSRPAAAIVLSAKSALPFSVTVSSRESSAVLACVQSAIIDQLYACAWS